ncbi:hypothetical protein HPC49_48365 [Pyxidicoccus fallax]|uniref:Uncharacterized protein n=1 Tax=Pyxidicoccus fallax TaxID=394095 RepID=A0A848LPE9_9BACT|nr:hypothetical protein [Pyxidicoccus fallax]NMO19626.1 hypothetical protein [Pyxidicoccus fallax]NPC85987.1 hypothetical protein [Pyxidicoccus fallax]
MPARLTRQEVETALRTPYHDRAPRVVDVLKNLPEDVDPALAAGAAVGLIGQGYHPAWLFAKTCRRLPVPVIHAVMERLEADRRPHSFIVREYVRRDAGEDVLVTDWDEAMQVLLDLQTTYAWGSKQKKAKFQALAGRPRVLQALQAAAVACEQVSLDLLAVLAVDASEASLDALIPHVERAVTQQNWELDRLQDLRTHARSTPVMDDLFSRMEALLTARRARSPALALAQELGFGEPEAFWFRAHFSCAVSDGVPAYRYQGHISVDSRAATWFSISLSDTGPRDILQSQSTSFNSEKVNRDDLGLGTCQPAAFATWLAAAAERFRIRWNFDGMSLTTSLRGKKRDQLERWLRGGS